MEAGSGQTAAENPNLAVLSRRATAKSGETVLKWGHVTCFHLNLHGFYTGTERILDDIARTVDGAVPEGPDWHSRLLTQLAAGAPGVRPPVMFVKTRQCLDEYRLLRHVVRNVYAFNFRPAGLAELTAALPGCFEAVERDLQSFALFLEEIRKTGA